MGENTRKYAVTLPDGRVVSRQRAHQLKHPETSKAQKRKWREDNREHLAAYMREWRLKRKEGRL